MLQGRTTRCKFFTRGAGDLASSSKLFTSLAKQLADKELEVRRYVCEAVVNNTGISQMGLEYQWRLLILEPLSRVKVWAEADFASRCTGKFS